VYLGRARRHLFDRNTHYFRTYATEDAPVGPSGLSSATTRDSDRESRDLEAESRDSKRESRDSRGEPQVVQVDILKSISEIDGREWDSLLGEEDSPFLEHSWLECLESSGTVGARAGWYPFHLAIREPGVEGSPGKLIGGVPMYAKTHSRGEFVFDHAWAEAAYYQLGIEYYPKLVAAIPFTPATGRRVLTHPDAPREAIVRTAGNVAKQIAESHNFSSVHVLFCPDDEAVLMEQTGFVTRKSVQNHFENYNKATGLPFSSFDEYVKCLKPNRRKALRRERKKIYEQEGIHLEVFEGDSVTEDIIDVAYELYETTCDKFAFQQQYLNRDFFKRLWSGPFQKYLTVILAKRGNRTIAGTFNVKKGGTLYGRYWGCFQEVPYLYFEACYYKLIELVISRNMTRMEAGAGSSGGGKLLRGFDASITRSTHFIRDPNLRVAIETFVAAEGRAIEQQKDHLNEQLGAFKTPPDSTPA